MEIRRTISALLASRGLGLAAALALVLAIWASAGHVLWREREAALAAARADIARDAERLADVASLTFVAADRFLQQLGQRYAARPLGFDFDGARRDAGDLAPLFAALLVVDHAGKILDTGSTGAGRGEVAPAPPAGRASAIGQPIAGVAGPGWTIPLYRRLEDRSDLAAHYVVGQVAAGHFRDLFKARSAGNRVELRLPGQGSLAVVGEFAGEDETLFALHAATEPPVVVVVERQVGVVLEAWRRSAGIEIAKAGLASLLVFGFVAWRRKDEASVVPSRPEAVASMADTALLRALSDGICEYDIVGGGVKLSPQLRDMFGISEPNGAAAAAALRRRFHPDDIGKFEDAARGFVQSGRMVGSYAARIRHRDGQYRNYGIRCALDRDAAGKASRIVASIAEIAGAETETPGTQNIAAAARDVFDAVVDGYLVYDTQNRLIHCSQGYRELYPDMAPLMKPGRTVQELAWEFIRRGIVDPSPFTPAEWVQRRMKEHRSPPSFAINKTKSGRWIMRRSLRMPGGGIVTTHTDVTGVKNDIVANEERGRLLDMILDNIGQGIVVYDADVRLVYSNRRFSELLDLPRHKLPRGLDGHQVIRMLAESGDYGPGDVEELIKDATERLIHWPRPYMSERTRPNGMTLQVHLMDVPTGGTLLVLTDISQRKRHETEIEAQRTRLQAIIANAPIAIAVFDRAERLMVRNELYVQLAAESEVDVPIGAHVSDLMLASIRKAVADPVRQQEILQDQLAEFRDPSSHIAERTFVVDGKIREIHSSSLPDGGTIRFFVDVTESRRVERMKTEFVSTVSHELRTPLTAIAGSLGLLAGGVAGALPDKARNLILMARSNSDRLVRLVSDILDMEKIESGRLEFRIKTQPLAPILRHAVENNAAYAEKFGAGLECIILAEDALAQVDEDRLHQVITNLLSNAAKFSPQGGIVRASLGNGPGDRWRIEIADQGPGIPETFRAHVFEPFAQADGTDARRLGGTGLGLSISKRIVERLGGAMSFETETDRGTRFFVDLPKSA